jgi:hypothetical protein
MLRHHNRLLVALHVGADLVAAFAAFVLAYLIRFELGLFAVPLGQPPLLRYVGLGAFIALLVPIAFRVQGLYRLRRGRTRVDDFFGVLVGSILAVIFGVVGTLYVNTYHLSEALKAEGFLEVSRGVWVLFLGLNIAFTYTSRDVARTILRRRWREGRGLKRVLIVGAGELGGLVADRILEHGELGFKLVGFIDDRAATSDTIGHRGLPVLGEISQLADVARQEQVDEIYAALPIDEHMKTLGVVEFAGRECIDVHVVPDLLQVIALRARLEDFDGLPIIGVNDVPLRGMNSVIKRAVDFGLSAGVTLVGAIPVAVIAWLIKRSSPGPVFYRQVRMGLDGKAFTVYKFRSMPVGSEETSGPVWAREDDPRATPIGKWLRRHDIDELPQFWNVLPNGRSSSSSSSTGFLSTCCVTRSSPASRAGRRSTAGAATRRSRSVSSSTSITSRTGR